MKIRDSAIVYSGSVHNEISFVRNLFNKSNVGRIIKEAIDNNM